jgi:hypothetical protein
MRESNMLTGGCFCGDIRYAVTGSPFHPTNCHCSICRRTTGAPFVAWFSVRTDDPEAVPPTDNTQSGTRLSWIPRDGHPDYPASRAASS